MAATAVQPMARWRAGRTSGWTWREVLRAASLTSIAVSAFAFVVLGGVVPIAFAVVMAAGLVWLRRPGRGGVVFLGAAHVLVGLIGLVLFQLLPELAYPASWKVFVTTGARLVLTLTAVVATVGALRGRRPEGGAPRAVAALAVAALLAFPVVGLGARLAVSDDVRQPGDVVLEITSQTEFVPRVLNVPAGRIAVHVVNNDVHHGTFTIDGVIDLEVPAESAQRVVFDVEPGRYRFYSKLYPGEGVGTMIVS